MCTLQRMKPISLLILGSLFSDCVVFYGDSAQSTDNVYNMYKITRRKTQFAIYVKFNLQYNKRQLLLSDLSDLRKLVKSVVAY